jgi:hypothetical protein
MVLRYFFVLVLFFSSFVWGDCSSYYLLGSKTQNLKKMDLANTIVWHFHQGEYTVSEPLQKVDFKTLPCQERGYVLINDSSIDYIQDAEDMKTYKLNKGWNRVVSAKDGVDVIATFEGQSGVDFVYTYEKKTAIWAGYSPKKKLLEKILSTRLLGLRAIEPGKVFYIYANQAVKIPVRTIEIEGLCREKIKNRSYGFLVNSGLEESFSYDMQKSVGAKSRYVTHYRRGIYDDTRIVFIYPKGFKKSAEMMKFGPAIPQLMLEYDKSYEGETFYVYDYLERACFEGVFPSMKLPPYPTLKKLQ